MKNAIHFFRGVKNVLDTNVWRLTNFGTQMFVVKKMLGDKTFLVNKFWGIKHFGGQIFRGLEIEWSWCAMRKQ